MKKILKITLSLVMVFMLTLTTFAQTVVNEGDNTVEVKAKKVDTFTTPDVISVDLSWGAMEFTYNVGGQRDWNPQLHTYSDPVKTWQASGNSVQIVNHSNINIDYKLTFAPEAGFNVTGTIDNNAGTLQSAVGKAVDAADKVVSLLTLDGSIDQDVLTKVGHITVSIKKSE